MSQQNYLEMMDSILTNRVSKKLKGLQAFKENQTDEDKQPHMSTFEFCFCLGWMHLSII